MVNTLIDLTTSLWVFRLDRKQAQNKSGIIHTRRSQPTVVTDTSKIINKTLSVNIKTHKKRFFGNTHFLHKIMINFCEKWFVYKTPFMFYLDHHYNLGGVYLNTRAYLYETNCSGWTEGYRVGTWRSNSLNIISLAATFIWIGRGLREGIKKLWPREVAKTT